MPESAQPVIEYPASVAKGFLTFVSGAGLAVLRTGARHRAPSRSNFCVTRREEHWAMSSAEPVYPGGLWVPDICISNPK